MFPMITIYEKYDVDGKNPRKIRILIRVKIRRKKSDRDGEGGGAF